MDSPFSLVVSRNCFVACDANFSELILIKWLSLPVKGFLKDWVKSMILCNSLVSFLILWEWVSLDAYFSVQNCTLTPYSNYAILHTHFVFSSNAPLLALTKILFSYIEKNATLPSRLQTTKALHLCGQHMCVFCAFACIVIYESECTKSEMLSSGERILLSWWPNYVVVSFIL
jgi:hypothetical protein